MKWVMLTAVSFILSGCYTTRVVEYREVAVTPVVVEPVSFGPQGPMDVTTTTIDFY